MVHCALGARAEGSADTRTPLQLQVQHFGAASQPTGLPEPALLPICQAGGGGGGGGAAAVCGGGGGPW